MGSVKRLGKRFIYRSQKREATFHKLSFPLIQRYLKFKTWWFYGRHYAAELDPTRIIWIAPEDVDYHTSRDIQVRDFKMTQVIGGDWDVEPRTWEKYYLHKSFQKHFNDGVAWEETEFFARIKEGIESGERTYHGCETVADIKERLSYIDSLYETIQRDGYRTQSEILEESPSHGSYYLDEICISIGRDGRYISEDGRHRLSIAKILDVDEVPVRVLLRHDQWQNIRDSIAQANRLDSLSEETAQFIDHPDIEYLL